MSSTFFDIQAQQLRKMCTSCEGIGQQKIMYMPPMSGDDIEKSCKEGFLVDYSHRVIRCDECAGTGEVIDWEKWCEFRQKNQLYFVQQVENIFNEFYHEVPL